MAKPELLPIFFSRVPLEKSASIACSEAYLAASGHTCLPCQRHRLPQRWQLPCLRSRKTRSRRIHQLLIVLFQLWLLPNRGIIVYSTFIMDYTRTPIGTPKKKKTSLDPLLSAKQAKKGCLCVSKTGAVPDYGLQRTSYGDGVS